MSEIVIAKASIPRASRRVASTRLQEATVWRAMQDGWRQLYGNLYEMGVSIEWHDFQCAARFQWSRSFHPNSLELCLNLDGHGTIRDGAAAMDFAPLSAGFYLPGKDQLQAWRKSGDHHRFITVEFSADFLRHKLARADGSLHPVVEAFLRDDRAASSPLSEVHRLTAAQEQRIGYLLQPPVLQGARSLWLESKTLELMAEFLFERRGTDEFFCDRQKRVARERVEQVISLLRKNIVDSLPLDEIGRRVGCSPYHLSRTFSAEAGMTISQYLRKLRMERAAELLQSGQYNVTEAALEVGYSSLSHFSQGFCQVMGRCPGLYPLPASFSKK